VRLVQQGQLVLLGQTQHLAPSQQVVVVLELVEQAQTDLVGLAVQAVRHQVVM
jgi:hypothetical protein